MDNQSETLVENPTDADRGRACGPLRARRGVPARAAERRRERFHERIEDVRRLGYDRRLELTWGFYLAYCEAAFRTRSLRDAQLVLTRPFNETL